MPQGKETEIYISDHEINGFLRDGMAHRYHWRLQDANGVTLDSSDKHKGGFDTPQELIKWAEKEHPNIPVLGFGDEHGL